MVKTVFLDIDGVLANFNKAACAFIDVPYPPHKWHWYKDTPDGFKKINDVCDIDFWVNLEWMPDGKEIFSKVVETYGINNVYLLTTPMPNPGSGTGKILWVEKHIPTLAKQLIITRASKSLLAKPDTLLIDDRDKNIDEFYAAGGQACLVPRPWNRNHFCADRTVEIVEKFLRDLK